jgi:aldose 1-epimerase
MNLARLIHLLCISTVIATSVQSESLKRLAEDTFGTTADGNTIKRYTLKNANGLTVRVMEEGAIITEILTPDREGEVTNVILGSSNYGDYKNGFRGSAAVIGRFANRIASASFTLDGKDYKLAANNGKNHIHGGQKGFAKVLWKATQLRNTKTDSAVRLSYTSADGEEGYPGTLKVHVTYSLNDNNELGIHYQASTDKPTVLNLTNHAYFNLAGAGKALGHKLWLNADSYTQADSELIPTGEIASVQGTPLDFTKETIVGDRIDQFKPDLNGYDHNFIIKGGGNALTLAAKVTEPTTGRTMTVQTTEPGVQLYTGNHLGHDALCLETQHYPDSPHHPTFPSVVLRPGQQFSSQTVFTFSAE